jgi:hypothetical protein
MNEPVRQIICRNYLHAGKPHIREEPRKNGAVCCADYCTTDCRPGRGICLGPSGRGRVFHHGPSVVLGLEIHRRGSYPCHTNRLRDQSPGCSSHGLPRCHDPPQKRSGPLEGRADFRHRRVIPPRGIVVLGKILAIFLKMAQLGLRI